MKSISFIQPLKTIDYHPDLIKMFLDAIYKGIIGVNIIGPIFYVAIFIKYVPIYILSIWLLSHFVISFFRLSLRNKLINYLNNSDPKIKKYVRYNIYIVMISGALWGIASIMSLMYAPTFHMFLVLGIILGLSAGATFTLTPILHAFLGFVFVSIMPLMVAFFFLPEYEHILVIAMLIIFLVIVIMSGYQFYNNLLQNIKLKDELKTLNESLEEEVLHRTSELNELNSSLEKRVEKEVEANRSKDQQLIQQSRLAQMGEMISMIAHQWRQPLSAISLTSINLKMKFMFDEFDLDSKEEQNKCKNYFEEELDEIEGYVQSLTTTIDDFRNFYKPNKGKKIVNINEPLQKALGIIKDSIVASGVEVIESFKADKEMELFDSELMQVYLNILKNAQDNFKEKKIENPYINITTDDTINGVKIIIRDNGGGIDDSIISKIFDPYFSTKDEKDGSGLGLYMSKTIIEEHHDGRLSVENIDDGVQFIIEVSEKVEELAQ